MRHLVIGLGEVGSALREVLACDGHDPAKEVYASEDADVDFLHMCFPFTFEFSGCVRDYVERFKPSATVIHSTVPAYTSRDLGCMHSPVRGLHPNIARGLRTFEKLLAHDGQPDIAAVVAGEFRQAGIPVRVIEGTVTSEGAKLWDTAQYGDAILLCKEIYAWCEEHGADFEEVYSRFNRTYNDGYAGEYVRTVLRHVPGPIGGHCVVPNAHLLDSDTARRITRYQG